jgi:histidyl-tRNA synthetase
MSLEESGGEEIRDRLDLFVAPLGEAALRHSGTLVHDLRRLGCSVEVAFDARLKRAMELANKLGARFTLIVGDNEIASGLYALKDMQSGEQRNVSREDLINTVGKETGARSKEPVAGI